jgi:RNA polymerase sigma factor for flagellar operon FliA
MDTPSSQPPKRNKGQRPLADAKIELTLAALAETNGNRRRAAELLGVHPITVQSHVRKARERGLYVPAGRHVMPAGPRAKPPTSKSAPAGQRKTARSRQADLLWERYTRDRSIANRNALAEHFMGLVHYSAEKLAATTPATHDDLVGPGSQGLLQAIESFDPSREIRFCTYAPRRVQGAMLDYLREIDHVPRLVRHAVAKANRRRHSLEQSAGHALPPGELDDLLVDEGLAPEHLLVRSVESIDQTLYETDSQKSIDLHGWLIDHKTLDAGSGIKREETFALLTRGLNLEERTLMFLYYYKRQRMKTIGEVLELSESRVSQMHSQICLQLSRRLNRDEAFELARA